MNCQEKIRLLSKLNFDCIFNMLFTILYFCYLLFPILNFLNNFWQLSQPTTLRYLTAYINHVYLQHRQLNKATVLHNTLTGICDVKLSPINTNILLSFLLTCSVHLFSIFLAISSKLIINSLLSILVDSNVLFNNLNLPRVISCRFMADLIRFSVSVSSI